jgi:membrane associated rhomboid family serine protease
MQFPSLARWQHYPVTVGIAASAVAMTLWTDFARDLDRSALFDITKQFCAGQLWRPLTSCLMHVDYLHLIFNLYWLWIFGAAIEEVFGSARMILTVIFLAVGSSLAQFAFSSPGIGLSGVGYGLFGMIWVLHRWDRRFRDSIDAFTIKLFIVWFFVCIAFTFFDIWRIGNVAHGSGALLGALLGFAIVVKDKRWKKAFSFLLVFSMTAIFAAASFGREYVNFRGAAKLERQQQADQFRSQGYQAHMAHRYAEAVDFYSQALAIEDSHADWWYNLGLCYNQLHQNQKAIDALRHAVKLRPENREFQSALQSASAGGM